MKFTDSLRLKLSFAFIIISLMNINVTAQEESSENKVNQNINLKNETPENLPLNIEILNADSDNWLETVEVKVTNTGKKPIYYLEFAFEFNNIKSLENFPVSMLLIYGNPNLVPLNKIAQKEDTPILSGESYTFKPRESSIKAFYKNNEKRNGNNNASAKLDFRWLSFGDGTGIMRKGVFFPPKYKNAAQ